MRHSQGEPEKHGAGPATGSGSGSTAVLPSSVPIDMSSTERTFRELAERWRADTAVTSSSTELVLHPAYQRIIGLGAAVLPVLFRELQERPAHWLRALS